jgi:hypothetical protein
VVSQTSEASGGRRPPIGSSRRLAASSSSFVLDFAGVFENEDEDDDEDEDEGEEATFSVDSTFSALDRVPGTA